MQQGTTFTGQTGQGTVRVALAQVASPADETPEARRSRVREWLTAEAAKQREAGTPIDMFVLPELWAAGYFNFAGYPEHAESLRGEGCSPTLQLGRELATATGAYVHLGTLVEREPGPADAPPRLFNAAAAVTPSGELAQYYRKVHPFGNGSEETELLTAGRGICVASSPVGPLSSVTCYDLRFPGLWQEISNRGASAVVVPAAWPASRLTHWRVLTQARAIENQAWVFACNSCGTQTHTSASGENLGEVQLGGHSRVISPTGDVLAEAGSGEQLLVVDVDASAAPALRAAFPVFGDRLSPAEYTRLASWSGATDVAAADAGAERTIAVSAVAITDPHGRVLHVRKRGTSMFMLPGGKPQPGETASATAVRELAEELGLQLAEEHLTPLGAHVTGAANEAGHLVQATVFAHDYEEEFASCTPAAEIAEVAWIHPAEAGDDVAPLNFISVFPLLAGEGCGCRRCSL